MSLIIMNSYFYYLINLTRYYVQNLNLLTRMINDSYKLSVILGIISIFFILLTLKY